MQYCNFISLFCRCKSPKRNNQIIITDNQKMKSISSNRISFSVSLCTLFAFATLLVNHAYLQKTYCSLHCIGILMYTIYSCLTTYVTYQRSKQFMIF